MKQSKHLFLLRVYFI